MLHQCILKDAQAHTFIDPAYFPGRCATIHYRPAPVKHSKLSELKEDIKATLHTKKDLVIGELGARGLVVGSFVDSLRLDGSGSGDSSVGRRGRSLARDGRDVLLVEQVTEGVLRRGRPDAGGAVVGLVVGQAADGADAVPRGGLAAARREWAVAAGVAARGRAVAKLVGGDLAAFLED